MEKNITIAQMNILTGAAVTLLLLVSIFYGAITYHDFGSVALWESVLTTGLSLCAAAMAAGYLYLGICVGKH